MSGFVKLDCGILRSTIWVDRDARDVFLTALLMAEPRELTKPTPQIHVRSLEKTGWIVPPGWYGFVPAAGIGIVNAAGIGDRELGLAALERMGAPEEDSRSTAFDGRRLVRVDGGFVVLNYMVYREKDHTAADRARRYREQKRARAEEEASRRDVTPERRDTHDESRDVTHAEAEAEAEAEADANGEGEKSDRRPELDASQTSITPNAEAPKAAAGANEKADVAWVFEFWKQDTGHYKSKLDAKRARRIAAQLRGGFTREQLSDAIRNRRNDPWLMGATDRSTRVYDDIETLLRDRAQVERLIRLTEPHKPQTGIVVRGGGGGARAADGVARQMQKARERLEQEGAAQ